MPSHDIFKELLSAYVDGELSETQRAEVEEHLALCDECGDLLFAYKSISDSMQNTELTPPTELHEKIMSTIKSEQMHQTMENSNVVPMKEPKKKRRYYFGAYTAVAAVAAFVILRSAGYFDGWFSSNNASMVYDTVQNADMVQNVDGAAQFSVASSMEVAPEATEDNELYAGSAGAQAPFAAPDGTETASAPESEAETGGSEQYDIKQQTEDSGGALIDPAGLTTEEAPMDSPVENFTISAVIRSMDYGDTVLLNVSLLSDSGTQDDEIPIIVSNELAEQESELLYVGNVVSITMTETVEIADEQEYSLTLVAVSITDENE